MAVHLHYHPFITEYFHLLAKYENIPLFMYFCIYILYPVLIQTLYVERASPGRIVDLASQEIKLLDPVNPKHLHTY